MHVIVSWDISATQPRWSQIDAALQEQVARYPNRRPLNTFYAVTIGDAQARNALVDALIQVAHSVPETVSFIVTPVMTGRHGGVLPTQAWWENLNSVAY